MLDQYRLDVDEAMSEAQLAQAAEHERRQSIAVWQGIANQLEKGSGPLAQMLMQFRQDAVKAMSDLVYANPNDAVRIAALQADVQRSLRTMEHIEEFRNGAEAAVANIEQEHSGSEEDSPPLRFEEE